MASNTIGTLFRVTTFGESHGQAIGAVIDGVPPLLEISIPDIQEKVDRRRPGRSTVATLRNESDKIEIISGLFEGKTTGAPVALLIRNEDARPEAYESIREIFRPGHADRGYHEKYGIRDYRGGGRASGRETAARVAAGAVAAQFLTSYGIQIRAFTLKAAGITCSTFDSSVIWKNPMYAPDLKAAEEMAKRISELMAEGDSAGGVIECRVSGCPPGLGSPVFDKLDADLAKAVMSIGAVKGIEFGSGFASADMFGSTHNDQMDKKGYLSNNAGGILGGISTGQDVVFRIAVKPTPSIRKPQRTIDTAKEERDILIEGRHDGCICPRAVPVVEAMSAIILADHLLRARALTPDNYTE